MKNNLKPLLKPVLSMMAAAVLLAACAAPDFQQPQIATPAAFKEAQVPAVQTAQDGTRWSQAQVNYAERQARGEWWLAFNDPTLTGLIGEATQANANLAVAAARVKQARAIAGIAEADRIPQVGVNVGGQRNRASAVSLGLPNGAPVAATNVYQANLTASYEVDLFGRVAANVSASRSDALAVEATYRSVLLSLQADVAQTYFQLRATDAELATLAETVRLREESVHVNQRRYDLGDIGEFDLSRARTELSTARAEAIGLQRQRATGEHALAVLLGKPAASFTAVVNPLQDSAFLPVIPAACRRPCWNAGPISPRPSAPWKRRMRASAWRNRRCSRP